MKDFTIGQVRNDVIEHDDNYYRPRTRQAGTINFLLRGDEFSAFSRDFCIDYRHDCFPIGRHSPFIASSVRNNCLSYFHRSIPLESRSHENLSIQKLPHISVEIKMYVKIKIRLAPLALPQLPLIIGLRG